MGFDTKPDLTNDKFEQFSGQTLSLSGCTDIYGELRVMSGASLSVSGGQLGYVLTSDNEGKATWQTTSGIAWSGSTINSVGTYIDSNTVLANTGMSINTSGITANTSLVTHSGFDVKGGNSGSEKTMLGLREIDKSNNLYGVYLRNNNWLESEAYDSGDTQSNGFISILRVNTENEIDFGTTLNIFESINLPSNPGKIPVIDLDIDYTSSAGETHEAQFRINYDNVFSYFGIADGAGGVCISGVRVNNTIQIESGLDNCFGYWQIAPDGADLKIQKFDGGVWQNGLTVSPPQLPPKAFNVDFTGTLTSGNTLTGSYDFYDINEGVESGSTYQWYCASDSAGTGESAISGATSSTYLLTSGDVGSYIAFGVVPISNVAPTTGVEVKSTYQGAIS